MDGLKVPVQVPADDPELENATYNGWLHSHFVTSVLVFAPDGKNFRIHYIPSAIFLTIYEPGTILSAQLGAPGSWNDSLVARHIYEKLRDSTPDPYYIVADTAFPRGADQVTNKIKAPLKDGDRIPQDPHLQQNALAFNRQVLSFRQTAEWGMRQLQGGFGRLRIPLDIHDQQRRKLLLENVCRLNNIRARITGISQIRSVYMRIWREEDGNNLWDNLGDMLIADIRRFDRVRRYHVLPQA